MSFHHAVPYIMTNPEQFSVRVCGCGVVHMSFGCAVINVSPEAAIAISETLREVLGDLRTHLEEKIKKCENSNNVISGFFDVIKT